MNKKKTVLVAVIWIFVGISFILKPEADIISKGLGITLIIIYMLYATTLLGKKKEEELEDDA